MALWQIALIAFVVAWVLQALGVWWQTRHYQRTFAELRTRWTDGQLAAGAAASRFGKGVIALLVVSPSGDVRVARVMIGRTVLAKFGDLPELEGLSLEALKYRIEEPQFNGSMRIAFSKAIEQIEKVRNETAGALGRDSSSNQYVEGARVKDATIIKGGALC